MQYRTFGKTNEQVSVLGFGTMRLPIIDGNPAAIDENTAIEMLHYSIDNGLNYIDTAYPYHGTSFEEGGQSEPFVGKALKNGYREKVKIATKLPSWLVKKREDMDHFLNDQLQRLQTDHIDFYLVHALNKESWAILINAGLFDFLDKALESGKIKHAGFSFHDDIDTFKEIVDAYDWSFCQIQYNYLDIKYQAGKEGLEYAASKGLGIAIMEPLRGGLLVSKLPEDALNLLKNEDPKKTTVEWALEWLYDHPAISIVLSGMSEMNHVVENIDIANRAKENGMTQKQRSLIQEVQTIFKEKQQVDCTGCRYCMPCPQGVDIPENFALYNTAYLLDIMDQSKFMYAAMLGNKQAKHCVECGKCEDHCPQNIEIINNLKLVHQNLHGIQL